MIQEGYPFRKRLLFLFPFVYFLSIICVLIISFVFGIVSGQGFGLGILENWLLATLPVLKYLVVIILFMTMGPISLVILAYSLIAIIGLIFWALIGAGLDYFVKKARNKNPQSSVRNIIIGAFIGFLIGALASIFIVSLSYWLLSGIVISPPLPFALILTLITHPLFILIVFAFIGGLIGKFFSRS